MSTRRVVVLLLAFAVAGCAVAGPDYHLSPQAVVNQPPALGAFDAASAATTPDAPPDHWWRLYDDPVLDGLIERALAANTDLRAAVANLERADAMLAEAGTLREPQAGADLETSWAQPSAEAVMQHAQPPEHQIYNGGISISYDLDLFGGLRRGVEAARADDEAVAAARDLVRVNVAAQTALAYAEVCNSGHQIEILQRLVGLQQERLRLTRIVVAHGRAPAFEAQRQEGGLEETLAQLPQLQAQQRNSAYRLAVLMGRPPAQFDRSLLACRTPLALSSLLPTGDGRMLLKRRPDVRAAERRLAAATARIGVATAALYPDVKLGATLGSTGSAADLLSPLTNRFGVGPLISWNLNRSTVRARIAEAQAATQASLANFDGVVLKALQETETSLEGYSSDLQRLKQLQAAQAAAAGVDARTEELRRGGRISPLAALDAQRTLISADEAVAAGQAEVNRRQIAVFLALGGGWS